MKTAIVAALAAAAVITPARAEDQKFTVAQCLSILSGLSSLNYAGQQFTDFRSAAAPPAGAPQYKLGGLRMTIATDIDALGAIGTAASRTQARFVASLGPLDEKTSPAERLARDNKIQDSWNEIIDAPCNVVPGRLPLAGLRLGDGPDQNAIPPAVLAAISPIIDQ